MPASSDDSPRNEEKIDVNQRTSCPQACKENNAIGNLVLPTRHDGFVVRSSRLLPTPTFSTCTFKRQLFIKPVNDSGSVCEKRRKRKPISFDRRLSFLLFGIWLTFRHQNRETYCDFLTQDSYNSTPPRSMNIQKAPRLLFILTSSSSDQTSSVKLSGARCLRQVVS